jgi:RNA polymerase sigma factor (sigma-70 family)
MARAPLQTVLQHLQTLAAARGTKDQTDGELLHAFASQNDQAAFTALVQRHGPLVLAVCRRVLHHFQEAEDAFQATFLLLARQAACIRKTESLASWLHGVAYRMATNARRAAGRRRRHEEQAPTKPPANPAWEAVWREVQLVLDQEIQRLPAKYRAPFVLCCLENRSGTDVARQLGLKEGTVWSRLTQARTLLRERLARRGITLSAVLGAAALAPGAERAAVPALLERATVGAALEFAAGQTAAGAVSAQVVALVEGGTKIMSATKLKIAIALVLAGGFLAAGAGMGLQRESPAPRPVPAPAKSEPAPPGRTAAGRVLVAQSSDARDADNPAAPEEQTARLVVRDATGKPVAGAHVYWAGAVQPRLSPLVMPKGQQRDPIVMILADGTTDRDGRCALRARFTPGQYALMQLVATAPGFGLAGKLVTDPKDPVAITLHPAVKIKGQLLTPAGAPAAGVRVQLRSITRGHEESVSGSGRQQDTFPPYWPAAVRTDNQGRFTLGGFSEGADGHLTVTHHDFAQEELYVSTKAEVSDGYKAFDIKPLKPEFKHTLAPARPVQGVVTAEDTGKPMTDVMVEVIPWGPHGGMTFDGRTDAQGRYRVSGHAATSDILGYWIAAFPPADSGYVAVSARHEQGWPVGAKFLEKNLTLPRGRLVRGRVRDADTGKPIAGASIVYQPKPGNPHNRGHYDLRNRVLSDEDGRFTVTALAGEGVLVAEGPSPDYRRVTLPRGEIDRSSDLFPHGYVRIDIPERSEPTEATLELRKGVTLEARVVGPDGSPVPWVYAGCREANAIQIDRWPNSKRVEKGLFRLTGADPGQTYRVFFIQPEMHLGAVADLTYDGKKPAEVRLQPTASVRGNLVGTDGAPARGYQAYALLLLTKEEGKLKRSDWFSSDRLVIYSNITQMFVHPQPNADGSFLVDNLIPGTRMYIVGAARDQTVVRTPVTLKPGEVKDLGTLTLAKEEQP